MSIELEIKGRRRIIKKMLGPAWATEAELTSHAIKINQFWI
jgi:hypothetical protein